MLRKVRCALFVDFENVALARDATALARLIAWLEDGQFDSRSERPSKRQMIVKRVYWNSSSEVLRETFEAAGFEVVLCPKFAGLRNGADIRIALDVAEHCIRKPGIEEYILFTTDSDFVPVLQRLRERKRRTTVLVDESKPAIYTVYTKTADTTFPLRVLMGEGRSYTRTQAPLLARLGLRIPRLKLPARVAEPAPTAALVVPPAAPSGFDLAIEKVVATAAGNAGQSTGRQSVTKVLLSVPGFSSNGADRYFGYGSYEGLIRAIAERDGRVAVRNEKGGGFALVYAVPPLVATPAHGANGASPARVLG